VRERKYKLTGASGLSTDKDLKAGEHVVHRHGSARAKSYNGYLRLDTQEWLRSVEDRRATLGP
jgi:hypothetical protein